MSHQLTLNDGRALLIDCGLFRGAEVGADGARADLLGTGCQVAPIVTHMHIDHLGRLP